MVQQQIRGYFTILLSSSNADVFLGDDFVTSLAVDSVNITEVEGVRVSVNNGLTVIKGFGTALLNLLKLT